ncbi:MAG: FAD-binding protein [Actinobacteria bacterium]|nr:MAG: FAD-binding protein [Actinomycetota bacterium]
MSGGAINDGALATFAEEVGADGPVACVGGRTQWSVGGAVEAGTREVRAPAGIAEYEPAEMVVRCGAGTTVADLDAALGEKSQCVALPAWDGATVGGVLAVGRSGIRRLGYGPVRDTLLEARYVSAEGRLVKAGGPVVKNVSGFDLCRLLVGSLGTLGLLAQVVLRCRPVPAVSRWFAGELDPFELRLRLHRPTSILWDGTTTWLLLEGHPDDVAAQAAFARAPEVDGPPPLPTGGRRSVRPSELRALTGRFVAEVGVGIVHTAEAQPPAALSPGAVELNRRIKHEFDPSGRLNPGRSVLA